MKAGSKNRIVTSRDADCIVRTTRVGIFDVTNHVFSNGPDAEIYVVEVSNTTSGRFVLGRASSDLATAEQAAWTAMHEVEAVASRWSSHSQEAGPPADRGLSSAE